MNSNNIYYQEYLRQIAEEQARERQGNGIAQIKGLASDVNSLGSNLSAVGNAVKNNVDNAMAQKFGGSMANLGGNLSNGANAVTNTLNAPQTYFKGVANNALGNAATKAGEYLAGKTGLAGALGNGLTAFGGSLTGAGTAAGAAGASTAAGAGAATGAATGAGVGAATAGTGAAAGGAPAGGAAAGGSAAGGAAAAGPIGALVALGIMAAQGTNRKRAKKSGEALLNQTNQIVNQEAETALNQTQQNTLALQEQAQQALSQGVPTGGAAQIQDINGNISGFPTTKEAFAQSLRNNGWDDHTVNSALNGYNLGNKDMASYIDEYNKGAAEGQRITLPQQNQAMQAPPQTGQIVENAKNSILAKFASGMSDLARGYQENCTTAFSPENLLANTIARGDLEQFKKAINPNDYTTKLTTPEQQQFNKWVADMKLKGVINPNDNFNDYDMQGYWKNEVLNNTNLANGSAGEHFTDKYKKPNHETFSNESMYATGNNAKYAGFWNGDKYIAPQENKSKMTRLGEGAGTIVRALNNPTVQGLIAGGISTALTGNPLYGVGQGYKFANQRTMNNIYQQVLKENGVDVDTGVFGNIDSSSMNALMTPKYKQWENELKKIYYDNMAEYRARMAENAERKTNIDEKYKEQKIINDSKKANAAIIKANKTSAKTGTKKPQDNPEWSEDLAGFSRILTNPDYADKVPEAKARFINKYGVDPMKHIKL